MKAIVNGKIITENAIQTDSAIVFDEKIQRIVPENELDANVEKIDAMGGYVLPGFVDIHVHGGGGADVLDGSFEEIETVTKLHASHGTTSLVATTLTCPDETLYSGLAKIADAIDRGTDGAEILGIHLEGPYFSGQARGAQNIVEVKYPTPEEVEKIWELSKGKILRWDSAPELPNTEFFGKWLKEKNIKASIGHSAANAETALWAYEFGFDHITHLYCSTTTEHKEGQVVHGGIVEATYLEDGFTVELIADGKHIPRETMLLVFKLKGAKKTALITDAMRAAGTDVEESILGSKFDGSRVIVEDGVAKLPDRSSFAGSIGTMDRALKVALGYGVPVLDAVRALTLTPAEIVNVSDRKGSLDVGKDADILITDEDFNLKSVYIRGAKYN